MIEVRTWPVRLTKRRPLTISRGTTAASTNLMVSASYAGVTGYGECAPGTGHGDDFAAQAQTAIDRFWGSSLLAEHAPDRTLIERVWVESESLPVPALAGLDTALWDLIARLADLPLHQVLGLSSTQVPSSVTIGINPPSVAAERAREIIRETGAKALKLKLGSPDGLEHDRASYLAVQSVAAEHGVVLRVDANGGWSVEAAKAMLVWLAERGCQYVEQPLMRGVEADLPTIYEDRPLPIFLDESVHFAIDVPMVADRCDGVNVKLMKCGGITEALRIVASAREHRLQTMIGCMSESSVAVAAGASIGSLFDYIDLDSNLNLLDEPVERAIQWRDGGWDIEVPHVGIGAWPIS
ncbi:MAG TPA: dipeptide epimerase [Fimbriimonadaceae bacterium]|nr:dipeptide epimerase [Fimbriimonadaceae bacterium]HRJ97138.1 dipeptide epimerase [Fimbriimonadaceae bacterium]